MLGPIQSMFTSLILYYLAEACLTNLPRLRHWIRGNDPKIVDEELNKPAHHNLNGKCRKCQTPHVDINVCLREMEASIAKLACDTDQVKSIVRNEVALIRSGLKAGESQAKKISDLKEYKDSLMTMEINNASVQYTLGILRHALVNAKKQIANQGGKDKMM